MGKFPFYHQPDQKDCGPTCLKMIARHYGRAISIEKLRLWTETNRQGTSLKHLADAAEKIGFRSLGAQISLDQLRQQLTLPAILHWDQNHFVVVYKITKRAIYVADPAIGKLKLQSPDFLKHWTGKHSHASDKAGIVLLLEPTPRLNPKHTEKTTSAPSGMRFMWPYIQRYQKYLWQLLIGLMATSLLELLFPFLTQSLIDIGIRNRDVDFIFMILGAQLFLFLGRAAIEIIRSWILLHLSTRLNISLISDFFIKLMRLPISYFDVKMTGDILQRINDHHRIENLLTNSSLSVLFSLFSLFILGGVLALYDLRIFGLFLLGSILYIGWISLFLKRRKTLDYLQFEKMGEEQSKVIELINGMQEIKLHNAEKHYRWKWEDLQIDLFKLSIKNLSLEQYQAVGAGFINELKNIVITIFAALLAVKGELTLGMLLAISYIIGQLNNPLQRMIGFVYAYQDARIALERLSEIHKLEDEETEEKVTDLPISFSIRISNVSYRYPGMQNQVLSQINLDLKAGQTTAIVGYSGSGKTTLLKLLLKFYEPQKGIIHIGHEQLSNMAQESWRAHCGTVLQDGHIFNDTIAQNIAVGESRVEPEKLSQAAEIANIKSFIESLPNRYRTKIGLEGVGLSGGQKQRILIARAVYKNPSILFFDEATSSLDTENEKNIMEKLDRFISGKTAVIVAHRLSTVKRADQIVVLDKGRVVEKGTHMELVAQKGHYYHLVKNQLELEQVHG